ncbi:hypothetical protein EV143_102322 [Flavobacterium chryseum]|uniref:DUF5367 family protein n=1 Tax=Flavobacterium sp. P3160 TaxID=2512113 RepID=UPI00105E554E|nr:DUF5367 family protein [Flavobacterium sp. P3160]TDO83058.1 hypothetical protein EV143_102322 [Flavobacterium sp. P3160]
MNYLKILLPGILVWISVSISFYILSFVPLVNSSLNLQAALVMMLLVFYANESAKFYYKTGRKTHGFVIGLIMSLTALLLDILITVPFIEIPNGEIIKLFSIIPFSGYSFV